MNVSDFKIGLKFRCGRGADKVWLCTDVGSRVIVGICISPASQANDWFRSLPDQVQHRAWAKNEEKDGVAEIDPSWLHGPPYALAEHVFDEHDLVVCEVVT